MPTHSYPPIPAPTTTSIYQYTRIIGPQHLVVKFSRYLEFLSAMFVHRHFCVSQAMSDWLQSNFSVKAHVLYDRPAAAFKRSGSTGMYICYNEQRV